MLFIQEVQGGNGGEGDMGMEFWELEGMELIEKGRGFEGRHTFE